MSEKKPKVLFIAPAQSSKTTHMILDEAKKEFDCTLVPIYELTIGMNKRKIKIMHKGRELRGYDYIFPRIDSKRAEYGYDIISAFEDFASLRWDLLDFSDAAGFGNLVFQVFAVKAALFSHLFEDWIYLQHF